MTAPRPICPECRHRHLADVYLDGVWVMAPTCATCALPGPMILPAYALERDSDEVVDEPPESPPEPAVPWREVDRETPPNGSAPLRPSFAVRVF